MTMKMVSILPPYIKTQRKLRRQILSFLSITCLISVILIISGIVVMRYRLLIESELSFIIEKNKSIESEIEASQEKAEAIDAGLRLKKIVENAMSQIPDWEIVLWQIVNVLPNEFYVEDIKAISQKDNFIAIRGNTTDQIAIEEFIDKINNTESVKKVEIVYVNKLPDEYGKMMEFEIKIYVLGTPYQLKTAREA